MFYALVLLVVAISLVYLRNVSKYDYFKRRNVPFVRGSLWSFIVAKTHVLQRTSAGYHLFPESRFSGYFAIHKPGYLIHDPNLIKQIAIKDFEHFTDHTNNVPPELDSIVGRLLFFTTGAQWKHRRAGVSPAFTGSKMRNMFTLLSTSIDTAMKRLVEDASGEKLEKEMKDLTQRIGNDVMSSISFGAEIDSVHDPNNLFFINGRRFSKLLTGWIGFKISLLSIFPSKLFIALGIRLIPQDVAKFYETIVSKSIKQREESNTVRPDFIHLLLQARKNELNKEVTDEKLSSAGYSTVEEHLQTTSENPVEWSDLDITAATTSFFFGGMQTTAVLICFVIYELSINPDVEGKLRIEIDAVRKELGERKLGYEDIQKMKYLDMVITETLRKWPPAGLTTRQCTKEYVMENFDGTKVTVEKGQVLLIPMQAIQRDAKHYPNPLRFDPERFSDENRHNLNQDTFLPFGVGSRNCMGSRLALMQAKCFIYYLMVHFDLQISKRTEIPIVLDNRAGVLTAKNGFWYYLTPRVK